MKGSGQSCGAGSSRTIGYTLPSVLLEIPSVVV